MGEVPGGLLDSNAKEMPSPPQIVSGGVVHGVGFESGRQDFVGAELRQAPSNCGNVPNAELYLDFPVTSGLRHRKSVYDQIVFLNDLAISPARQMRTIAV